MTATHITRDEKTTPMGISEQPGKFEDIHTHLLNARKRLETAAQEAQAPLQWADVETALGPHISPRFEDREYILTAVQTLAAERATERGLRNRLRQTNPKDAAGLQTNLEQSRTIQNTCMNQLNGAILHKALYRAPSIHRKGWTIRRRLQELLIRARGRKGQRLEIVGRGENRIGYLRNQEESVRRARERGIPFSVALEKYGYPTDLVIRQRFLINAPDAPPARRPVQRTTWLVEVEPSGLARIGKKIQTLHEALERRFFVSQASNAGQARRVKKQLPEEASKLAIVFYTGTQPTLNQATEFFNEYKNQHNITDLQKHFKRRQEKASRQYRERVLAGHDQEKLFEQQLLDAIQTPGQRQSILSSRYPVHWLVPLGDALFLLDLKRAARMYQNAPETLMHTPLHVPKPNKKKSTVSLQENVRLPSLEKLRRRQVLRHVGTLRPAIL